MLELKELPIKKIKTMKNIRTQMGDLNELMQSMKQYGLLEPVGVWKTNGELILIYGNRRLNAAKKLGWKTISSLVTKEQITEEEFLLLNTVENIHRKEISPVELGRICQRLKELGLSNSEIGVRLSIGKGAVEGVLKIYKKIPEEYRTSIGYVHGASGKKGKISYTIARAVVGAPLNKAEIKNILDYAKKGDLTVKQVELLIRMVKSGIPFGKCIKNLHKILRVSVDFIVDKKEMKKLVQQHETSKAMILREMMKGEISVPKKLFVD